MEGLYSHYWIVKDYSTRLWVNETQGYSFRPYRLWVAKHFEQVLLSVYTLNGGSYVPTA